MGAKIGFYERLKEHIPEQAARLIAEEMTIEGELSAKLEQLATKDDLERFATKDELARFATKDDLHRVEMSVERLRSSMFRWQLTFFVPMWLGVYGTLAAILFRGSP